MVNISENINILWKLIYNSNNNNNKNNQTTK